MFLGWILVLIVDECIALSLGELASRYPTSAGPYYWSFQLAPPRFRTVLSFVTGWTWLIGNWTITLSVNFGFASLIAACVALYHPDFIIEPWQLLLIFYAICGITFLICAYGNRLLPAVDTACAAFTAVAILVTLVCLSAKAEVGRNEVGETLGGYDTSLSGWGGFSFFIGVLPAAYTFSAIGMVSAMAEECDDPAVKLPRAIALCVPVGGVAGLFFVCLAIPFVRERELLTTGVDHPYMRHHAGLGIHPRRPRRPGFALHLCCCHGLPRWGLGTEHPRPDHHLLLLHLHHRRRVALHLGVRPRQGHTCLETLEQG